MEAWAGCIAGALHEDDYRALLAEAGFTDIGIEVTRSYSAADVADESGCCAPAGRPAEPPTGRRPVRQRLYPRGEAGPLAGGPHSDEKAATPMDDETPAAAAAIAAAAVAAAKGRDDPEYPLCVG